MGVALLWRITDMPSRLARLGPLPSKNLEIPSLLTTVRRRPDRSRPPQVGPAGHTCTASAARTEPAKHSRAMQSQLFQAPSGFGNSPCFPTNARLPNRRSREAEPGGAGGLSRLCRGIISPACLSCLSVFPAFPLFLPFLLFSQALTTMSLGEVWGAGLGRASEGAEPKSSLEGRETSRLCISMSTANS